MTSPVKAAIKPDAFAVGTFNGIDENEASHVYLFKQTAERCKKSIENSYPDVKVQVVDLYACDLPALLQALRDTADALADACDELGAHNTENEWHDIRAQEIEARKVLAQFPSAERMPE